MIHTLLAARILSEADTFPAHSAWSPMWGTERPHAPGERYHGHDEGAGKGQSLPGPPVGRSANAETVGAGDPFQLSLD